MVVNIRAIQAVVFLSSVFLLSAARQSACQTSIGNIDVQPAQLLSHTIKENWLSYNGDYTGRRYSSLAQIDSENVRKLRAQWVFHSKSANKLEVTPIVVNGVMYITGANEAYALNSTNGRALWHYSRPNSSGLLWEVAYADWNKNYGATSAPLIVRDKVLVGTSGGDSGVRGFLAAYDTTSGKLGHRGSWFGGSGLFRAPGNSARKAGREMLICTAAARPGCRAPTMINSIPSTGALEMPLQIMMAAFDPEMIYIRQVYWRSMRIRGN
jgi:hypothetical protein